MAEGHTPLAWKHYDVWLDTDDREQCSRLEDMTHEYAAVQYANDQWWLLDEPDHLMIMVAERGSDTVHRFNVQCRVQLVCAAIERVDSPRVCPFGKRETAVSPRVRAIDRSGFEFLG